MTAPASSKSGDGQAGVTLIEMVITIVILGIALTAIVSAIASMTARSADPVIVHKAVALAQSYLDEILSKSYDQNSPLGGGKASPSVSCSALGPDGEADRSAYNDVDDYAGLSESPPRDHLNQVLNGYDGYSVSIRVDCLGTDIGLAAEDAKRIDVDVTPPGYPTMTFSAYRGYY